MKQIKFTSNKVIVGIDIGATGAMTILQTNGDFVYSIPYSFNDYRNYLLNLLQNNITPIIIIENVHSMPKQGVRSVFSFGERKGEIIGLLKTLQLDFIFVEPRVWKKHFNLIKTTKKDAIEYAKQDKKFDSFISNYKKTTHSGMADSYLIAKYGLEAVF